MEAAFNFPLAALKATNCAPKNTTTETRNQGRAPLVTPSARVRLAGSLSAYSSRDSGLALDCLRAQ